MKTVGRNSYWHVLVLASSLVGCYGTPSNDFGVDVDDPTDETPGGGGDGGTGPIIGGSAGAQQQFEASVFPILAAKCASCHSGNNTVDGPDFLGPAAASAANAKTVYRNALLGNTAIVGSSPDNSLLLLKGLHTGPALAEAEAQTVSAWIVAERGSSSGADAGTPAATDAGTAPSLKPQTLAQALERFGKCMSLQDWGNNTGMDRMRDQGTTEGPCSSCHSTGTGGAFLSLDENGPSNDPNETFKKNRTRPAVLKLVNGTVDENGNFADLVAADRFRLKGIEAENCDELVDTSCHPKYTLNDTRRQALQTFMTRTLERYHDYNNPCE